MSRLTGGGSLVWWQWTAAASEGESLSAGPAAIETQDLSKRYGARSALAGLTIRVERGEVFGYLPELFRY